MMCYIIMNPKSMSFILQISVLSILLLGNEITIAKPRGFRSTSLLRQLVVDRTSAHTGPCFSGELAMKHYLLAENRTKSINSHSASWTRSMTQKTFPPTLRIFVNEQRLASKDLQNVETTSTSFGIKLIKDGKMINTDLTDYRAFKTHKTYVIQDKNSEMPKTYYWIGAESSDIDAGEAAAQAVWLDSQVNKTQIRIRKESEGIESSAFKALFKSADTSEDSYNTQVEQDEANFSTREHMFLVEEINQEGITVEEVPVSTRYINDTEVVNRARCFVFLSDKVYWYCTDNARLTEIQTAGRLSEIILRREGLNEIKTVGNIGSRELPKFLVAKQEDNINELLAKLESVPEKQIVRKPYRFTRQQLRRIYDQTSICANGSEQFRIQTFRMYGKHEWSLTDMSFYVMPMMFTYIPINTLKNQECYLVDSCSNNGLIVWMGKESGTFVRAEAARNAELHLRKRRYYNETPITFIDQEEIPPEVKDLEELVHFVDPMIPDGNSTSETEDSSGNSSSDTD